MNYHKKLKDLGFKKHNSLVIIRYSDYSKRIEGYHIRDAQEYLSEKLSELNKSQKKLTIINFPDMMLSLSKDDFKKLQTYKWKISDDFNLYVTIHRDYFCCFGNNQSAPDIQDSYMITSTKNFIVFFGKLDDDFWKSILNNLPLQYKREIILKDII